MCMKINGHWCLTHPHANSRLSIPTASLTRRYRIEHGRDQSSPMMGSRWICMTYRDTLITVAEAISVRLDPDSIRALHKLQATGMSQSEAIRRAIIESANALKNPQRLAIEIAALEADEEDRAEMIRAAELMELLRK